MLGISTLVELYLGSEPMHTAVDHDQLLITLADNTTISIPLQLLSQLRHQPNLPPDAQLLVWSTPPQIDHVHVTDSTLTVYLQDGRALSVPLAWFPRLIHATAAERNHYELHGQNDVIHWPALDEDIDLLGLIQGGRSRESEDSIQRWLALRASTLP